MSYYRPARPGKPAPGAMTFASFIDEDESEDDLFVPAEPSTKGRRMLLSSVTIKRRRGESVEFRIPQSSTQIPIAEAEASHSNETRPSSSAQQKPKRSIKDFFAPIATPVDQASTASAPNRASDQSQNPGLGSARQEEAVASENKEEEPDANQKRAAEVTRARAKKAKLQPQYQYDYDIDGNGAKKWFLLVQSSKTSVEKIKIRKQFIPEDRLCFDRWGDMTRKEKSEYGNVFKNFLEAQIPSFKPQISEKKRK